MASPEMLQSMIEEYRSRIQVYQTMIAEWERELGIGGSEAPTMGGSPASSGSKKPAGGDPLAVVTTWQFFNKSQPEAAKLLLEAVGHPLYTEQIVEGLEKGGVEVGGSTPKDKKQNLYTILGRSGQFGRAAKNTWGLLNWPNVKPVNIKKGSKDNGQEKDGENTETEMSEEKTEAKGA
jgi:hypothetical protein